MPNVIYTVRPDGLLREADSIERSAKESQKSWIMLGQLDKYSNAMQEANLLRRAAAEKSVYTRREILRNAGYTVKTPKALSKNPKTRNIEGATMATKKFSPAQIAAQKLFAERARAGTLGKGKRKANPVKGEKTFKTGDYVKTDRGEIGRVSFYKDQPKGYANVYRLIDVKANDPYAQTFLENGNFINGTRLKAYKRAMSPKYNEAAVNKSIASSRSKISASEGKTIKRLLMGRTGNPVTETLIYGLAPGETRDYMEELMYAGGQKLTQAQIDKVFKAASDAGYHSFRVAGFDPTMKPDFAAAVRRKRNPDKAKPRAYVKRASQATGAPPSKRLLTRRKKALSAPAGYFPNPKTAAMMTGYQVICMHPKKHVVGIFKTMAEAKMVATALANAKGVPYAVKTVKVHKAHFAA